MTIPVVITLTSGDQVWTLTRNDDHRDPAERVTVSIKSGNAIPLMDERPSTHLSDYLRGTLNYDHVVGVTAFPRIT